MDIINKMVIIWLVFVVVEPSTGDAVEADIKLPNRPREDVRSSLPPLKPGESRYCPPGRFREGFPKGLSGRYFPDNPLGG
jgi:hypothetical protein